MEELLYRYNPWWEKAMNLEGIIERKKYLEKIIQFVQRKQIFFLTGLRRVGKTTLLKLLIKHLIEEREIPSRRILYISLDDYRLKETSLLELVDHFRKLHSIPFEEKIFLFFDEITFQKNFEQQLKNLYDTQHVSVFASSSSASLLKGKKPFLTGRSQMLEILPLDFDEYLEFKGIQHSKRDKHLLENDFESYLQTGGIPEYVLNGDMEYLKELVDDLLMKDIVAYHGIRDPQIIKDFFLLLMERVGKQCSINKMANILSISPDTARRYLEMFENIYLIYLMPRCGKTNERLLSSKKIYVADLGIKNLFTGFRDKGAVFENYIYLKIKDKNPCYLSQDGNEIDFLTNENTLIEVKYGREMGKKQQALFDQFPAKRKRIISSIHDLEEL
ncbi:MAG: ATP-binding protein [bacterium]|nr:ATP-binding protein [bacterium]